MAGEVTRAGSRVLAEEGLVATADAPVVKRLRAAGAVIVAKTNMSEFAFSGVGANPHFGTPAIRSIARACPAARLGRRGSRSPTACARSPSAPTPAARPAFLPPYAGSSAGSQASSGCRPRGRSRCRSRSTRSGRWPKASECALADAVMAARRPTLALPLSLSGLRFGIWQGMPFDGVDATVSAAWSAAVARLGQAGVRFSDEKISLVDDMMEVNAKGGFAPTRPMPFIASGSSATARVSIHSSACGSSVAARPVL